MMQDISLAAAFGRLAIVAVLMAAVLLVLRRTTKRGRVTSKRSNARAIELIDRQNLGKAQSVAVIRVQDHTLVLGVTEQRVELIATLPPVDDLADPAFDDDDRYDDRSYADEELLDLRGFEIRDDGDDFFQRLTRRSGR